MSILQLEAETSFFIGQFRAYVIDVRHNNLPTTKSGLREFLIGRPVIVSYKTNSGAGVGEGLVSGIEFHMDRGDEISRISRVVSIVIQPIKTKAADPAIPFQPSPAFFDGTRQEGIEDEMVVFGRASPKHSDTDVGNIKTGIELIAEERYKYILQRDYEENEKGQLFQAASLLLEKKEGTPFDDGEGNGLDDVFRDLLPEGWNKEIYQKMYDKPYRERLITAAALIAAEIDRLLALEKQKENLK